MTRPAATLFLVCLAGFGGLATAAEPGSAAPPSDPRTLTYPPLSISFPRPQKVLLSNGLLVYLFEDHELPLIDLAFFTRAGSIYDPDDKVGLTDLLTTLMRTGGTEEMSPDQVDEALESLPAPIDLSADTDSVHGSLSALRGTFPEALKILGSMLRAPRLDPARLDLEKARLLEDIRRRWDDPRQVSALNFRKLVYGAASPWARLPTTASIGRITRDDLREFHRRFIRPNNTVLGVAGDFEPAAMKKLLEEALGKWSDAKVTPPRVEKVKDSVPVGVHLISRPLTQTSVEIGHLGVNRFDPDKFPLKIANFILGEGGFSARLMREVRSNRGLAYSVQGGVGMDSDRGLFRITCRTKAATTVEAIQVIRDLLVRFREEGPTEQEVREAKEAEINSFVFSLEGTVPYMNAFLYYDYHGYPEDYLKTYRDNLAKVTREQVARAARKHLHPDQLVVLAVGDEKSFERPLASLGLGEPRIVRLDGDSPAP
jgi:zinc protease